MRLEWCISQNVFATHKLSSFHPPPNICLDENHHIVYDETLVCQPDIMLHASSLYVEYGYYS